MVQRCNGTTAELNYLEVNVICPCNLMQVSPLAVDYSVRAVDTHWGESHKSSADFNPKKITLM